jgi:DnaJ family protein B protein 12
MSGKASGSQPQNGDAKNRAHHDGSSGRAFTVEQKAAVIRIKRCTPTAYYEILGLEAVKSTCSDSDIKKAYRKLSLLTHPDKNGYDGADDAFKLVSKAFQVLSDPDKKKKYDAYGGDPDARFDPRTAAGGGGGGGFSGAGFPRGGGGFQEEMTPEELFRQFFGGAFGGPFGTSNFPSTNEYWGLAWNG